MAYIVMVYIVMACIAMTYVVLVCADMAYIVIACMHLACMVMGDVAMVSILMAVKVTAYIGMANALVSSVLSLHGYCLCSCALYRCDSVPLRNH